IRRGRLSRCELTSQSQERRAGQLSSRFVRLPEKPLEDVFGYRCLALPSRRLVLGKPQLLQRERLLRHRGFPIAAYQLELLEQLTGTALGPQLDLGGMVLERKTQLRALHILPRRFGFVPYVLDLIERGC